MTICSGHVLFTHHGPLLGNTALPSWVVQQSFILQIRLHSPSWADSGVDTWPKLDQWVPFPRSFKNWDERKTDRLIPSLQITLSDVRPKTSSWHDIGKMEKASLSRWDPTHQERPKWEERKVQSGLAMPESLAPKIPKDRPLFVSG